jgi:hypothetical protein
MTRLGMDVALLAKLGVDARAEAILQRLEKEGVSTVWVKRDPHLPTGKVAAGQRAIMGRDHYGLRPSSNNRNEESAFSMIMRSMRPLSILAMVSTIALPIVRTLIFACISHRLRSAPPCRRLSGSGGRWDGRRRSRRR